MKAHMRFFLDSLNPIGECEGKSKSETVEWGFEKGYHYRKCLELKGILRAEVIGELNKKYDPLFTATLPDKTSGALNLVAADLGLCPHCLNNPAVEKVFNQNEISLKLYDAKFRGLIDGDQLFKLLEYFEEKDNEKD